LSVTDQPDGAALDSESANCFKFYASGRQNCIYFLTTIELKKRQDLITMAIFNLIWPERDRISIEIPLDISYSIPVQFGVVRRKDAKTVHANNPDFKGLCRKITIDELSQYTILAESEENISNILTPPIMSILKKHDQLIQMLSVSDQRKPYKLVLRLDMIVPKSYLNNPKEFHTVIKMLLHLADQLPNYKMSQAERLKAEKERQIFENLKAKEDQKEKNEEIQKKLQEKKKEDPLSKKKEEDKRKHKMQRKFVKAM